MGVNILQSGTWITYGNVKELAMQVGASGSDVFFFFATFFPEIRLPGDRVSSAGKALCRSRCPDALPTALEKPKDRKTKERKGNQMR